MLEPQKQMNPISVWTWIWVTLMWGSVFFFTSIYNLYLSASLFNFTPFKPELTEVFSIYGFFTIVMVLTGLVAMVIKRQIDPTGEKQIQRQKEVFEGKREKLFVSFSGSLATSFGFGFLTAYTYMWLSSLLGFSITFEFMHVVYASGLNMIAGIIASVLVGFVFIGLKMMGKLPTPQQPQQV
jgi:hypothetical protein